MQTDQGLCCPLTYFTVSKDSVSGQLWTLCTNALADLGLFYYYVPKETFSHDIDLHIILVKFTGSVSLQFF